MKISKQARREAKQLFVTCLANGRLEEGRVRTTVSKVIESKPRGYVAILSHFQRLVRLEVARRSARVETAIPLPEDLQTAVKSSLARVYGEGLNVSFAQSPALIGGMRVKVASDVYDGSVQARLAALRESFSL